MKRTHKTGKFERCVKAVTKRGGAYDPKAVCAAKHRKKGNPAEESLKAFRDFHGREAEEIVTVQKRVHFHKHLAGAGKLEFLKVETLDGKAVVSLHSFNGTLLSFNEKQNQLFIEGGSQHVSLKTFGVKEHELVTLGHIREVGYFTRKDHLVKDGGTAIYVHKFHKPYPDLIYYTRDEQLAVSGGGYEIAPEGIKK